MSIQYRVEACSPQAHLFRVTLTISAPSAEGECLSLPAWIPGSYMIREFARNIVEIRASQADKAVALEKLDKHSWRTAKLDPQAALVVECVIYAWDLSVRCAHLDQSHGFFNGTQLFLRVAGREQEPHRVDIRRPEGAAYAGWKVATTLPAAFHWPRPDKRREFLRGRLNERGELELHPHQGSGVLSSAAWSDGLIDLPPQTPVSPGDRLRWLPWPELLNPALSARQP